MGLPVEINPLLISSSGYVVGRSLRFRSSASAYLNRTPASAGNRQKFTWSGWVKRGTLGASAGSIMFSAYNGAANQDLYLAFGSTTGTGTADTLNLFAPPAGNNINVVSAGVYRDTSAWYHIVCAVDTTQATAANRVRLYVNGSEISYGSSSYPSLNQSLSINSTNQHTIGVNGGVTSWGYLDGYLGEINFIDGQQLTPSSFGAYDTNGVWQPLKYGGTYGTNGFYLPFSNTTSTTTLVQDSSGNGNNWTPNNISLTAGTTYDSMIDSPTVSASSSNYAVLNPILANNWWASVPRGTIQDGNLTYVTGASTEAFCNFDFVSNVGKWYFELNCAATDSSNSLTFGAASRSTFEVTYYQNGNKQINGGGASAYGATWTSGDVIGVAVDTANNQITFYKNNVSQGAITNTFPTNQPVYAGGYGNSASGNYSFNFGQRPFTYTPPTGYSALNTYNLPTPTIKNGALYNAATLYTGNGSSQSISNSQNNGGNNPLGKTFYADFLIQKARSAATNNVVYDTNRGANYLWTNSTAAEVSSGIISLTSTGFNVGSGTDVNANGTTYVGWQWNAGSGTTSTNTSGSITSTVSANTTAGFSVVTYAGQNSDGTVGHGLGVSPSMIIIKNRSLSLNWIVYHISTGNTGAIELSTTSAFYTKNYWQNTNPTSSVFYLAYNSGANNATLISGSNYVAYCFAAVRNYSAMGSYTGNGSSDGPFIYTGFRPRWVMVKKSSAIGNWLIFDTSRSPFNVNDDALFPNLSDAETTTSSYNNDFLSNGFKVRTSDGSWNDSGVTYIYAAFAENPFNYSRAR